MRIRTFRGAKEAQVNKREKKKIREARDKVAEEISQLSKGGKYASAMAGEGYAAGYRDALDDMILLGNGVTPRRRNYWD